MRFRKYVRVFLHIDGANEMIDKRCTGGFRFRGARLLCLTLWAMLGMWPLDVVAQNAVSVQTRHVEIDYTLNREALPIQAVEMWVTADRGSTWQLVGQDQDLVSPATFDAPSEGLFGLFLIIKNATGPSSLPPTASTPPQRWVFVDETPPVVQLHPLQQTVASGDRVVQIRWTAIDSFLPDRPIELQYRTAAGTDWYPVVPGPLPNTGQFDWHTPPDLSSLAIRAVVQDRGGHRVASEPGYITITPPTLPAATLASGSPSTTYQRPSGQTMYGYASPTGQSGFPTSNIAIPSSALTGSPRAKQLANRYMVEAATLRDQGDLQRSVARLREAVRLDPDRTEAFAEMASMLYRLGDFDRAMSAYDIVLRQEPASRSALLGAAAIFSHRKDYVSAEKNLRTVLRNRPNDAEVWMNLGDIAIYQGNEGLARESYTRATQIDPSATKIISDARSRLLLMDNSSRTFRSGG